MAFNPLSDLNAVLRIIENDEKVLELMDLTGSAMDKKIQEYRAKYPNAWEPDEVIARIIRLESIIRRSRWDDLAGNDKRLCIFFVPDRRMRNESFLSGTIEINIHTPAIHDYRAWECLERINELLHRKKINNRYIYLHGQLGELPTMQGFFCCGSQFNFSRLV